MKKILMLLAVAVLAACSSNRAVDNGYYVSNYGATPTVDYVEQLNVSNVGDSFLNQLAMNYRSYAIFNARQSGHPDIGEIFAQKAVAAFSGELPFPEPIDRWPVADSQLTADLQAACQDLINLLKNDMSDYCPREAAEAQAKYDCWLTASSSGQIDTANECRARFNAAMSVLRAGGPNGCGTQLSAPPAAAPMPVPVAAPQQQMVVMPMTVMPAQMRAREGVVIVNNVNVPQRLINPEPVQPMVFNQNIYGGDKSVTGGDTPDGDYITRQEFADAMMALHQEIQGIYARLDNMPADKVALKVQQIPLKPNQQILEEVVEINFDFDKYKIKPEFEDVIRQLAKTTRENRNVRVSVIGHTDTMGTRDYNFALGGRRAEAVRKMLVSYGIPDDQIVAVSSGENDLKVQTGDQVKNAANRRVRVVKEERYLEQPPVPYVNAVVDDQGQPTQ